MEIVNNHRAEQFDKPKHAMQLHLGSGLVECLPIHAGGLTLLIYGLGAPSSGQGTPHGRLNFLRPLGDACEVAEKHL